MPVRFSYATLPPPQGDWTHSDAPPPVTDGPNGLQRELGKIHGRGGVEEGLLNHPVKNSLYPGTKEQPRLWTGPFLYGFSWPITPHTVIVSPVLPNRPVQAHQCMGHEILAELSSKAAISPPWRPWGKAVPKDRPSSH